MQELINLNLDLFQQNPMLIAGRAGEKIHTYTNPTPINIRAEIMAKQTSYKNQKKALAQIKKLINDTSITNELLLQKFMHIYDDMVYLPKKNIMDPTFTVSNSRNIKVNSGVHLYRVVRKKEYKWNNKNLDSIKAGRMNNEHESVFYLSFNPNTAKLEVPPVLDEPRYLNEYEVINSFDAVYLKKEILTNKIHIKDVRKFGLHMTNWINSLFGLKSGSNDFINQRIYLLTNRLKQCGLQYDNAHAIIYPSVKMAKTNSPVVFSKNDHSSDTINYADADIVINNGDECELFLKFLRQSEI